MQDFRNIRRSFVLNKALVKFNKHNGTSLRRSEINMIYCCWLLGGLDEYVTVARIFMTLRFIRTEMKQWPLDNLILRLRDKGYLVRTNDEDKADVKLTIQAFNVLKSFETCLKKERWNR